MTADGSAAIREAAARVAAAGESPAQPARDPVNLPMINNWVEALGDASPVYTDTGFAARSVHRGLVAPPAMIQVWTMRGLHPRRDRGDPLGQMMTVLDEAGFTSVVATNCEQEYHRYLRHGEHVSIRSSLESVTGPKRTSLGEGWFVTTRNTWYAGQEAVASMTWRVLKFRPPVPQTPVPQTPVPRAPDAATPPARPSAGEILRPAVSRDTAFFWDGTAAGELRIQRCGGCGALRHPPGPMCPACGAAKPGYVVAAGTGEVYSYVVQHHPPVPGKELPIVVALVQLPEGVRVVGELLGVSPERARIGLPVRVEFVRVDDALTLPAWREDSAAAATGAVLPELTIDVTPTFVIAAAIATRDFQDVHHDRDRAVERGSKDIFINILTTTGLVQRYVTDWAGPEALVRAVAIRLGVPCYAGDTLTLSGTVAESSGDERVVNVVGRCSLGDHVTGTVRIAVPGGSA